MDILTLKSKDKLGCKQCDKCCIYRGDIRLTPINVCNISKFLNLSIKQFLDKYTERLKNDKLELVLKTTGELKQCILYNKEKHLCEIHSVKPMQCVMFPLVPYSLNKDYFYNSGQCLLKNDKKISVYKWLNGNNNLYKKNKKSCMEWIRFIENIQPKLDKISNEQLDYFYRILFENYDIKKNYNKQMTNNIKQVENIINN